jgi:DNA-binding transcriptional MerR regulator
MKSGDLARLFGVSSEAIRQWTEVFAEFLSDEAQAKNTRQRLYNDTDVLVLATVARYSADGLSRAHIREKLTNGERVEHPGIANYGVDTRMVPAAAVEQLVDATELRIELEQVKAERDKLLEMLDNERTQGRERDTQLRNEIKLLQDQVVQLQRELGRAEGRLEEIDRLRKHRDDDPTNQA